MSKFKKISIGEVDEKTWLMDALKDYINENPMVSEIELNKHFKIRIDILSNALVDLRINQGIERIRLNNEYYFRIFEITDEDLQEISLQIPFGNF